MQLSSTGFLPAPNGMASRRVRSATCQRLSAATRGRVPAACAQAPVLPTRSSVWVKVLRTVGLAD